MSINPNAGDEFAGRFTVTDTTLYRLEPVGENSNPASGFLVLVSAEEGESNSSSLVAPIDRANGTFPKEVNLLDYRVFEICKTYEVKDYDFDQPAEENPYREDPTIPKIVFLELGEKRGSDDNFSAMAMYDPSTAAPTICLLKPGKKWVWIDEPYFFLPDFITHKGKYYAITDDGKAIAFDSSGEVTEIASAIPEIDGHSYQKSIGESAGDLFLLHRYWLRNDEEKIVERTEKFEVFKLDENKHKWVETKSLGDRTLFLGEDFMLSISTGGFKGNTIYLLDRYSHTRGSYTRMFDLEDGTVHRLHGHPIWSQKEMHPHPTGLKNLDDCPSCT